MKYSPVPVVYIKNVYSLRAEVSIVKLCPTCAVQVSTRVPGHSGPASQTPLGAPLSPPPSKSVMSQTAVARRPAAASQTSPFATSPSSKSRQPPQPPSAATAGGRSPVARTARPLPSAGKYGNGAGFPAPAEPPETSETQHLFSGDVSYEIDLGLGPRSTGWTGSK